MVIVLFMLFGRSILTACQPVSDYFILTDLEITFMSLYSCFFHFLWTVHTIILKTFNCLRPVLSFSLAGSIHWFVQSYCEATNAITTILRLLLLYLFWLAEICICHKIRPTRDETHDLRIAPSETLLLPIFSILPALHTQVTFMFALNFEVGNFAHRFLLLSFFLSYFVVIFYFSRSSGTRLIEFYIALIPFEKIWIQWFSLKLWLNSRVEWFLQLWLGNQSRRRITQNSNLSNSALKNWLRVASCLCESVHEYLHGQRFLFLTIRFNIHKSFVCSQFKWFYI